MFKLLQFHKAKSCDDKLGFNLKLEISIFKMHYSFCSKMILDYATVRSEE